LGSSIAQVTSLVPSIGCQSAAKVAKLLDQGVPLERALALVEAGMTSAVQSQP
jgi:hypothetical protein